MPPTGVECAEADVCNCEQPEKSDCDFIGALCRRTESFFSKVVIESKNGICGRQRPDTDICPEPGIAQGSCKEEDEPSNQRSADCPTFQSSCHNFLYAVHLF